MAGMLKKLTEMVGKEKGGGKKAKSKLAKSDEGPRTSGYKREQSPRKRKKKSDYRHPYKQKSYGPGEY